MDVTTSPRTRTLAQDQATPLPYRATTTVACAPGFSFQKSLAFACGFSRRMAEQTIEGAAMTKAFVVDGQPVLARIRQEGSALVASLASGWPIAAGTSAELGRRIAFFFSAEEDMAPFRRRAAEDPWFSPIAEELAGFHHVKFPSPFEAACWAAIHQRCQLAQARAMKQAICACFGAAMRFEGATYLAFPEADTLARAGEDALREAMRQERKAAVVHRIARAFAEVDERWLREAPVAEVEAWLLAIRGVGPFTTALVMFRGLGRSSAQPIPPQLLRAAKRVYGPRVDAAAVRALSASYGRWAGHWALYLRASAIEGIGARHAA